jgi:hypothetical protein
MRNMKLSTSLSLALLSQAIFQCSAFQVPSTPIKAVTTLQSPSRSDGKLAKRAPAILVTLAASLLPHPKLANAIGIGSRVPLPTTPGGVELNKRIGQTTILFVWTLFIVTALEWNGFEYFRHLACRIRSLGKDEEVMDVGLAKESDWDTYSHLLDPLKEKKVGIGARVGNWFRRLSRSPGMFLSSFHYILSHCKVLS